MISISHNSSAKRLYEDLHSRPFPLLNENCTISYIAMMGGDAVDEQNHLKAFTESLSASHVQEEKDCLYVECDNFSFRWERHTEFSTYSFLIPAEQREPFSYMAANSICQDWLDNIPGTIINAINVELRSAASAETSADQLRDYFEGERLIASYVYDNKASIWTAFRLHNDGFGRYFILSSACNQCERGRVLRTLLELESYRTLAMLAHPEALSKLPTLQQQEEELAEISEGLSLNMNIQEQKNTLDRLLSISANNERLIAENNYRFAASKAYSELVDSRLEELDETAINGMVSISSFVLRRLRPAMKTCRSIQERILDLNMRSRNVSELLRSNININMQAQNQSLLQAMNERARLSLILQKSVEGMSVVVISYYCLSLLNPYIEHLEQFNRTGFSSHLIMPPVVLAIIWFLVRRMKKAIKHGL